MCLCLRPLLNAVSAGFAVPVFSTGEDAGAIALSLAAIFLPLIALIALVATAVFVGMKIRKFKRRRKYRDAVTIL
ncbi:DUF4126 family protein [Rothia sp. ZJ1223]|uniref:DUF4126 family protein n=1 Tax=Rothia sp. ZJ1223 TaxID=2811098 RepID=UPI00195A169D|nr:DUF4126 family protein [Rothia sp. ZJ1223]MBM7052171.1 DUF4126 family protein [Rothia sp. ZJ1223]